MNPEIFSTLVGVNFRPAEAREIVKNCQTGHVFDLEAEPSNPYDVNAVKVIDPETGAFVGYLSRESNAETAAHLAEGGRARATIVSFLGTYKPHLSIEFDPAGPSEGEEDDGSDSES